MTKKVQQQRLTAGTLGGNSCIVVEPHDLLLKHKRGKLSDWSK